MEPLFSTIITGFLGAGKTTLLYHLLYGNHGLRIAVLIDELGAMNIDLQFIAGEENQFIQLPNGCCCHLLNNNLPDILATLLMQPIPPDYLIVEASGIISPRDMVALFKQQVGSLIQIDSVIAVVDAEQIRSLETNSAQLAQVQIQEADFVILNKIDLIPSFTLAAVKRWLEQIAPEIRTFETSFGQIPLDLLIGIGEYIQVMRAQRNRIEPTASTWNYPFPLPQTVTPRVNQQIQTSRGFQTWTYTSEEPFDYASLCQVLETLPNSIFRVKGRSLLANSDRLGQIQLVGRRGSLKLTELLVPSLQKTQIVAVGRQESMNSDRLFQQLDSCRISVAARCGSRQLMPSYDWIRPPTSQ